MTRQRCQDCPMRTSGTVFGRGTPGGVAIVGQAPGPTEARRGRIFTGRSGEILVSTVRQTIFEDVYYTNAISCGTYDEPSVQQINACRGEMWKEIEEIGAKKVLLMGNAALQSFFPGAPPITVARPDRLWHEDLQVWCVPTLNAAAALHDPEVFKDIGYDFEIFADVDTKQCQWSMSSPPPYVLIDNRKSFIRLLNELDRSATHISFDIETTGLNEIESEILTIGLGDGSMNWIIEASLVYTDRFVRQNLQMILEDESLNIGGHNAPQFDWKFLWAKFRIDVALKWDTMLQSVSLDERNVKGLHKLKPLLRRFLAYPSYAEEIEGRFENYGDMPREQLYQYQAWDTQGTWELHPILDAKMHEEDEDLIDLHNKVLVPGARALAVVEMNGVRIDVPYLIEVGKKIDVELEELQSKLQVITDELGVTDLQGAIDAEVAAREHLEWAVQAQARGEITGRERIRIRAVHTQAKYAVVAHKFNPNSSLQVKKLITEKLRLTGDTTKDGLEAVQDRHPAPKLISEYRGKQKLKGTYVDGLTAQVWPSTGRVHGSFLPNGARTGRLSGVGPNWQNVPVLVGPIIRDGVVASSGWRFGEADNSQVELRTAGVFSRDERLIQVYRDGRDIHREVAVTMYNKPADQITDRERYNAKYVDFPILFGATAESLVGTGEPPWDLKTARKFVDGFLTGFPQLHAWMENQKKLVKQNGYVKTLFGRLRRYPLILPENVGDIERQSINSPIQGSASDLCFTALTRIVLELLRREKLGEPVECRILLTVHDSIAFEAVAGKEEFYGAWITTEMEKYPETWPQVGMPLKSELKLGDRWGSCKELKTSSIPYWEELREFVRQPWRTGLSDEWVARLVELQGVAA